MVWDILRAGRGVHRGLYKHDFGMLFWNMDSFAALGRVWSGNPIGLVLLIPSFGIIILVSEVARGGGGG